MDFIKNLKFSENQILNKEFQVDYHGYNPQEVDVFLDEIVVDYKTMKKIIEQYDEEIKHLSSQTEELKNTIDVLVKQNELLTKENEKLEHEGFTKADLIKRIKSLEDKFLK